METGLRQEVIGTDMLRVSTKLGFWSGSCRHRAELFATNAPTDLQAKKPTTATGKPLRARGRRGMVVGGVCSA